MLTARRLSIYVFGLLNLIFFYLILIQPEKVFYFIAGLVVLLFILVKFITGKQAANKDFLIFFSLVLLFVLASWLFLLIVENFYLKYFIILFTPLLVIFYLRLLLDYLYSSYQYRPFSLVSFFEYLSILIVFFTAVTLFAWQIFLTTSFWLIALILSIVCVVLLEQNFWLNKFNIKKDWHYALIFFIIIFETAALLTWWPISYYVKGFILAICYYLLLTFANRQIKKTWQTKIARWYVLISLIIILILLITTRWL